MAIYKTRRQLVEQASGRTQLLGGQQAPWLLSTKLPLTYLLSVPSVVTVYSLKFDPVWDPLRELPRFKELLAKYSGAHE